MAENAQVHDKFKLFVGELDDAGHVNQLAKAVHEWVAKDKVAVKSVGAAVAMGKLMLSIGFRDDEPTYEIVLHSSKIGRVGPLDADESTRFNRAIESSAMNWPPVLGHALYVTNHNDLYLVVLSLVEPPRE
ncbi:MAG: hypothetical protein ABI591_00710 [Kofleriaceae bacterium]